MTDQERDSILVKIYEQTTELIPSVKNLSDKVDKLEKTVIEHGKLIKDLYNKFDEHSAQLKSLNRTVTLMEFDHGEKLKAIFDALSVNSDKFKNHEDILNKHEKMINSNKDEIYILKSKIV